jgi:hypothetical protein
MDSNSFNPRRAGSGYALSSGFEKIVGNPEVIPETAYQSRGTSLPPQRSDQTGTAKGISTDNAFFVLRGFLLVCSLIKHVDYFRLCHPFPGGSLPHVFV